MQPSTGMLSKTRNPLTVGPYATLQRVSIVGLFATYPVNADELPRG